MAEGPCSWGTGTPRIGGSYAGRVLGVPVEFNPTRMCELLVGLPDVNVLAVDDRPGEPIVVHLEARLDRVCCRECGSRAVVKERPVVELVDLLCFGGLLTLVWVMRSGVGVGFRSGRRRA